MSKPPKIYIAGALTHLSYPDGMDSFYQRIYNYCKEIGMEPYAPYLNEAEEFPDITPEEIIEKDISLTAECDILIAYVGEPSIGTGMELGLAYYLNKKIIIFHEEGVHVSCMATGISKDCITYKSFDEGLKKIKAELKKYV